MTSLYAACTPNSLPDPDGRAEHGYQITVLDDSMTTLATIDLPDWDTFRPASAGHRLIEHGFIIHPGARKHADAVNGWRRVSLGYMVPVMRLDDSGRPTNDAGAQQPGAVSAEHPGLASRLCPPGYVWLGDFSGYEVGIMRRHEHDGGDTLCLHHRCGWAEPLAPCGTQDDHSVYVGNIIERALEVVEGHTCRPYEPSPEHQARVARWQSTTDVTGLDDIPERPDAHERVSGPPVQRPGLLYSDAPGLATPQHRVVDGPGCTPAFVPGVLRAVHDLNSQTTGSGHGPEDYDQTDDDQ